MSNIFIAGGSTFDTIVYLDALPNGQAATHHKVPFQEAVGSTGVGKALPLTYLGHNALLYTAFGNDRYGRQIEHFLKTKGIPYLSTTDPAGTERHINLMDKLGQRISMFITQSSVKLEHPLEQIGAAIAQSDVLVLNIVPYCIDLIPALLASGKPIWTDLHDYDGFNSYHQPFIEAAQYIQLSSDNLNDYEAVIRRLLAAGKQMVVCTHGKKGATLATSGGDWIELPAIDQMEIKDSNGAGDSFFAGLITGHLLGKNWTECLQYGLVCGALAITDTELACRNLSLQLIQKYL
ncbi:MAG: carbohydrate kinase family protein [Chitinophagaceae bacterium]|nr:carbohydrate kinase family protein [Chitinophagaceae bacterium]